MLTKVLPKTGFNQTLFTVLSLFVSISSTANASGHIEFDLTKASATLKAEFKFFGNIKPDVLKRTVENIERQWSGLPALEGDTLHNDLSIIFKGRLKFKTELKYSFINSIEEAKKQYLENKDTSVNFVRVEESAKGFNSSSAQMGHDQGGCLAFFSYSDALEESTTAAHEFGHLMGLGHVANRDRQSKGRPRIMTERGSILINPEFSRNPNERFPTVHPDYRRVSNEDIWEIPWNDKLVVYEPGSNNMRGIIKLGTCFDIDKKTPHFKPEPRF